MPSKRRQQLNLARQARYHLKKKRGQCTKDGCYTRITSGIQCDYHKALNNAYRRKSNKRESYKERNRKRKREEYAARVALGMCVDCSSKELVTSTRCAKCRARFIGRNCKGTKRCSIPTCKQFGHDKRTCPQRFTFDVNRLEYATARQGE